MFKTTSRITQLLVYFGATFFTGFGLLFHGHNLDTAMAESIQVDRAVIEQIQDNRVIYLGEHHDSAADHAQQLAIITNLYKPNHPQAIALEMFQRPFQPMLNRYLAGTISESELRAQTEYDQRWGYDWEYYVPILRFAQAHQIPLLAINTPAEITRKVAKHGLNSLEKSDFRYIPALENIKVDNAKYRQQIAEIYQQHAREGNSNSDEFANFFVAQILWDETMAEAIANYHQTNPQSQIMVLVGEAHVAHNYAIPDRLTRRIGQKSFRHSAILLSKNNQVINYQD